MDAKKVIVYGLGVFMAALVALALAGAFAFGGVIGRWLIGA